MSSTPSTSVTNTNGASAATSTTTLTTPSAAASQLSSATGTISVLLYSKNETRTVHLQPDDTSESICRRLCQELQITPACTLLFALRIKSTGDHLPGNRSALPNESYEFRLRFQIKDLTALKRTSKVAYDYFYHQVKCDLIAAHIPGLEYPAHKEQVTGLCVTNMYIDMLEQNLTVDYLMANYQRYVPAKYVQKHSVFIKRRISKTLNTIRNKNHDSYYVKGAILESIKLMAPNYLVERCAAIAAYLPEDDLRPDGACPVELEFSPYHPERPGLSVYYPYKKRWEHVARIADIYAVVLDTENSVQFEIRDNPAGFVARILTRRTLESFVSCICGYYRLMVKWTVNLCSDFKSPQLASLMADKCHGPIGGQFAYVKLQEKQSIPGSYIVRQCERSYGTYYIDIITKGAQPETFRLTNDYGMWQLHGHDGGVQSFNTLPELARSVPTEAPQKLRLAPSEYDRTATLLLCQPPNQLTAKKTLSENTEFEMRKQRSQILGPQDFRKYLHTGKLTDGGAIKEMKADWILPDDKKLEVTLKVLQDERKLFDFMRLADKWSGLFAPELVKMYGFTLSAPQTFCIESIKMGPLDEFLRTQRQPMADVCMIDAAYTLARALHYLQENEIVHGRIRCSKLQVVKFTSPSHLVVRLGDPGFPQPFQQNDVPWIPLDYPTRADRTQLDYKDEIWAFATTLWEIFARGHTPTVQYYLQCKRRLPQPLSCPRDIYNIMLEGWDVNPDRRFTPQQIFSRLITARDASRNTYELVVSRSTSSINGSVHSDNTENTNLSYTSNGFDGASNVSESSLHSGYSLSGALNHITLTDGHTASATAAGCSGLNGSGAAGQLTGSVSSSLSAGDSTGDIPFHLDFGSSNSSGATSLIRSHSAAVAAAASAGAAAPETPQMLEFAQSAYDLPDGSRVVLQGEIGYGFYGAVFRGQMEDIDENVTPVAVKTFNQSAGKLADFEREFKIMQRLNHPNIVKIIAYLDDPVSIVMEFVEHRSFLMYLNSRAPTLTTQMLLKFARDIASGMQYLVDMRIVHRDLAARNVLVDSNECIKISDFGLAQVTDGNGYYTTQHVRNIPIKWYAPETLATIRYSHYSDVWSYGVTLFEMFSRGNQPDLRPGTDLTLQALLECLQAGERLKKPPLCPDSIYTDLMMPCWHIEPKQRPDFGQILEILNRFVAEFGEVV